MWGTAAKLIVGALSTTAVRLVCWQDWTPAVQAACHAAEGWPLCKAGLGEQLAGVCLEPLCLAVTERWRV